MSKLFPNALRQTNHALSGGSLFNLALATTRKPSPSMLDDAIASALPNLASLVSVGTEGKEDKAKRLKRERDKRYRAAKKVAK